MRKLHSTTSTIRELRRSASLRVRLIDSELAALFIDLIDFVIAGCTEAQADKIIELRPYTSVADLKERLGQGKKKAGPLKISPRMFEDSVETFEGYSAVDDVLEQCEAIGAELQEHIARWQVPASGKPPSSKGTLNVDVWEDGALALRSVVNTSSKDFLFKQPVCMAGDIQLKEYQLLGLNWLRLMHMKRHSGILADEMGLGKTVQVISFLAHLHECGSKGPHLIVVPASTLENWVREFAKFAPSIKVQTYYGKKDERGELRARLVETMRTRHTNGWEVLITTYTLASGDERDRKFMRRMEWDTCVFDEGHMLKNYQSQLYKSLIRFGGRWKLLLTGTPLQNNLQELVSLMNFIHPKILGPEMDALRAVFKTKGDSKVALLAKERVERAKRMMTPFVLRRRKEQVLKDLPDKRERIEWCEMTPLQRELYDAALARSRKTVLDIDPPTSDESALRPAKKPRTVPRNKDKKYLENSSNVLMDLRKASSHTMLFRTRFTDRTLTQIAKLLAREDDWRKYTPAEVKEDLEQMSDMDIQRLCYSYNSTQQYLQDPQCYYDTGKVTVLLRLLEQYMNEGRKVLLFSQFVQNLDILIAMLEDKNIRYLVLTGQTPVDQRQALVDEFTEDESIPLFLLSTKAGGMGINLTAASVVILFDQDFNPHNDKQAQDRAYRIGQRRAVDVIKLITRDSIEEDMLRLGQTKLALDAAVAGEADAENVERQLKTSLMSMLRKQASGESQAQPMEVDA
ncbi:SNF2 family N-terminal domain-containing protein [Vararia minispora EC-137]|uniref:SNF2 family N-terminal domain-containing protein n=1 Tax=Vararia minispora EC-137 TaxID=1314806 RepID=A0ACB8QYP7_9AGAM|nr:SNF2 family N-terminal domain-containing protein [Vararia minispora EC-137]